MSGRLSGDDTCSLPHAAHASNMLSARKYRYTEGAADQGGRFHYKCTSKKEEVFPSTSCVPGRREQYITEQTQTGSMVSSLKTRLHVMQIPTCKCQQFHNEHRRKQKCIKLKKKGLGMIKSTVIMKWCQTGKKVLCH